MRKTIHTLSCLLLLFYFKANAQGFKAGFSAGLVATDVYGADIHDNDADFYKAGFVGGGAVSLAVSKKVTIGLEMNYIQKGTEQHADSTGVGFYKYSFSYVEVPLVIKYRLHFNRGKKSVNGFELHAGVSAGELVKSKTQGDNFYTVNDFGSLNRTDVSLLAGVGYNFSEHFNFSFRYSNSVIPVFKKNEALPGFYTSTINNGNNLVLHFILQYVFGGGKGSVSENTDN